MTVIRKAGDWLGAKVGDELVMMSAAKGKYLGLSEVGARIWELIETPQTIEDLCSRLIQEYDVVPQTCRAEAESFVAELVKHGAVAVNSPLVA